MAAPSTEIDALGRAAGDAADRLAATPAQTLHAAIAERVFGALGPAALPARVLHDGISTAIYAGLRLGFSGGARIAATIARHQGTDPMGITRSRRGSQLVAAANALIGHELALEDDPLAIHMGLWRHDEPFEPNRDAFLEAFPEPTGDLLVFVHGLGETEQAWRLGQAANEPYGDILERDLGWTPLHVRYNTGLPIAENGRRLSWLLTDVAINWPVDIERIALVGHSMGGLVARSAGQVAAAEQAPWRDRLTHLACLGTPHRGAPLEQLVAGLSGLLARLPEAAAFGGILEQRSPGIRDLRRGIDCGPLLDDVRHLFVTATFTQDPDHPAARAMGDLLVRPDSAGAPYGCEVADEDIVHLSGVNHFQLLNHRSVFEHLESFLQRR
jgi:pimeloyl-ACP methyl ester carboxylesterase